MYSVFVSPPKKNPKERKTLEKEKMMDVKLNTDVIIESTQAEYTYSKVVSCTVKPFFVAKYLAKQH